MLIAISSKVKKICHPDTTMKELVDELDPQGEWSEVKFQQCQPIKMLFCVSAV